MDQSRSNANQSRSSDRMTESLALPDQLDEAANYIKKLPVNVEKKKERKRKLVATSAFDKLNSIGSSSMSWSVDVSVPRRLPKLEIQETSPVLHIFLVTSMEHKFLFHEITRVITEEAGAEITHAGYSILMMPSSTLFIASVELSEKHQSFRSPKVYAEKRADRRAIASAIRGELIRSFVVAP
ncbi:hypothetical protein F2Q70_00034713 [Brassica cretica]|uniref:Uncharacterized protein n=1 Tax=Brassica cretica TaxID=69181 RepID=A0A8S9JSR1_BRACR|nr:hypothetical protein F2Q70_00034713 [Brassica cretica]